MFVCKERINSPYAQPAQVRFVAIVQDLVLYSGSRTHHYLFPCIVDPKLFRAIVSLVLLGGQKRLGKYHTLWDGVLSQDQKRPENGKG